LELVCEANRRRIQQYHGFDLMAAPVLRCILGRDDTAQGVAYQDNPMGCDVNGG
jgi:hypothetical protein